MISRRRPASSARYAATTLETGPAAAVPDAGGPVRVWRQVGEELVWSTAADTS